MNHLEVTVKLTKLQMDAVAFLTEEWAAGPKLPESVCSELESLRELGFVERQFADTGPSKILHQDNEWRFSVSSCWFFRLSAAGLDLHRRMDETRRAKGPQGRPAARSGATEGSNSREDKGADAPARGQK